MQTKTTTRTLTTDLTGLSDVTVLAIETAINKILAEAEASAAEPVNGWTPSTARIMLNRLRGRHRNVQADTLERMAENGGSIGREEVYELAGYDSERSLKGFTRPVTGDFKKMVAAGLIPEDAEVPLTTDYDATVASVQQAGGFHMSPELAEVFAQAATFHLSHLSVN